MIGRRRPIALLSLVLAACITNEPVPQDTSEAPPTRSQFFDLAGNSEYSSDRQRAYLPAAFGRDEEAIEAFHTDSIRVSGTDHASLASVMLRHGRYAEAARNYAMALHNESLGSEEDRTRWRQSLSVAQALSSSPRQNALDVCEESFPTNRDRAGLRRMEMTIGGRQIEAVVDTGANISVIQRSLAEELGLVIDASPVEVHSMTGQPIQGSAGIAAEVTLGSFVVRNTPFLVFEDEDLTFGGGPYEIPAIIGFPILGAMRTIQFSDDSLQCAPSANDFDIH